VPWPPALALASASAVTTLASLPALASLLPFVAACPFVAAALPFAAALSLEKPITYTLAYRRLPNYEMVEFVCDNNREFVDEKGVVRLQLRDR